MKEKHSLILDDDFIQYCKLNNIENVEKLAKETFKRGFDILKYGEIPKIMPEKVIVVPPVMIKENKSTPEPSKEVIIDTQKDSVVVTQPDPKSVPTPPQKDLYDE